MANYTPSFINHAQSFINDLLIAGGKSNNDQNTSGRYYNFIQYYQAANAKVVCDEIISKKFNFTAVDNALKSIANLSKLCTISLSTKRYFSVNGDASILADYIAWFCIQVKFKWDDTKQDPYKMEQLKKYSTFGKALADAYRYKSEDAPVQPASTAINPRTGQPPKSDYKSSGPQSSNVRGLVGTPGQKETVNGGNALLYVCEFDKINKNIPSLFVAPLESKGDAGNGINKVLAGSANGYTDCTCYFATRAEADNFLANFVQQSGATKVVSDKGVVTYNYKKYTGLCVKTARNLPGFYKVKTTCGDAYINAKKLNEEVEEGLEEAKEIPAEVAKTVEQAAKNVQSYNIYDIDVYEEAFNRYI